MSEGREGGLVTMIILARFVSISNSATYFPYIENNDKGGGHILRQKHK